MAREDEVDAILGSGELVRSRRDEQPRFLPRRTKTILFTAVIIGCAVGIASKYWSGEPPPVTGNTQGLQTFFKTLNVDPNNIDSKYCNDTASGKEIMRKLLLGVKPSERLQLKTASCIVDVTQGTFFLERAALALTAATASCRGKGGTVLTACVADASAVFAAFAFVAEYISEAVFECSKTIQLRAECSAGISGVIANTGRLAVQAATIAGTCTADRTASTLPDTIWQMTRRLEGVGEAAAGADLNPSYGAVGMGIATCTLDAPQAAVYLAQFGIAIDKATKNCDRLEAKLIKTRDDKIYCAAEILDLLEALFMASSFISSAVSHCSTTTNQEAICASGAVGLAGGLTGLSKNALNIVVDCGRKFPPIPVPVGPRRRKNP